MIETRVRVITAQPGRAWVTAAEATGCGACHAQSACGVSGLGRYFSRRAPLLAIPRDQARPGDELLLRIDETDLLRAGLFAYLLPTLLGVSAAAGTDAAGLGDVQAVLAAAGGVLLGLFISRWLAPPPRLLASAIPSSPSGASNE